MWNTLYSSLSKSSIEVDTTIIRSTENILKMLQHLELMYNVKFMSMTMNAMLNI